MAEDRNAQELGEPLKSAAQGSPEGTEDRGAARPSRRPLSRALRRRKTLVFLLLVACCVFIAYARLALRTNIVCTHFAYLPIVLTGLWWGKKSIWVAGLLGLFIICLKLLGQTAEPLAADLVRALFFIAVALSVGTVSEMAKAARMAEEKSNKELEIAHRRLLVTEKLASMGQLSAGVAHEINNPLGTILIYSHMLLKQAQPGDPRQEELQMIVSEATRCRDIVRGLLDFARQSRVSKEPADLAHIIDEVVTVTAHRAEASHVRVTREVEPGLPAMSIDAAQVRQMLVNLVENGVDAAAGAGEVRISARRIKQPDGIEIKVTDNGCGIPEENLSEVFTPFFTTKQTGGGTGLGLAIAYGVAKMHSGDISVQSEVDKGTTFSVILPLGEKALVADADAFTKSRPEHAEG